MREDIIERSEAQLYSAILKLLNQSAYNDCTALADCIMQNVEVGGDEQLIAIFTLLKKSGPAREMFALLTDAEIASELTAVAASIVSAQAEEDDETEPEFLELA